MKYTPHILASLILTLGAGVLVAHAQYTPLAPLPGTSIDTTSTATNLSSYLSGMLKLIIALGGALAILMVIIGGTQYVAAGISPDAKSSAKEHITNAFIGLALILSSYLILNSIDPKLVAFNLSLDAVTPPALINPSPSTTPTVGPAMGAGEISVRDAFRNAQVLVNNSERVCPQGMNYQDYKAQNNGNGCTTLEGLPWTAITGIVSLKQNCSCTVMITGGTEAGHQTHGVGFPIVDMAPDPTLNTYITNNGTPITTPAPCGVALDPHYKLANATYVFENGGTHWHVCY